MNKQTNYKQTEIGEIPEDWESTTLGKLADITSSKRIFASEYLPDGIPFFRGKEIIEKNNGNSVSTELFISEQKYQDIKDKFGTPEENDILLTSVGTLGVPYRVTGGDRFYFKDGNITWFRDLDDATSEFLFHWLNSDFGKRRLIEKSIGSTQQALTIIALKSVEIALPPIDERKQVASILSSLDDKIELNRRMNKTLEEMGKALFKRWFVDFEFPNKEGKPYKSNGGEMVDSEIGKIPKGWKLGKLNELVDVISCFDFSSSIYENDGLYGLVTIKNVLDGEFEQECSSRVSQIPEKMPHHCYLKNGDILLSLTGNVGRVCYIHSGKFLLNQRVAKLLPKNEADTSFTYFLSRQDFFKSRLISISRGTAQQNLSPVETARLETLLPPRELLDMFSHKFSSLYESLVANSSSSSKLLRLRNSLLPRLMSGKLRVN